MKKLRFLALFGGPGGFRELREAGRNHFHLPWYLLVLITVGIYKKKLYDKKSRLS